VFLVRPQLSLTETLNREVLLIKHIVYFDYGGSHTSVTAAAIHAGKLKPGKLPTGDELMAIPYLDKTIPEDFGKIQHMGTDDNGNEIYKLGTKSSQLEHLLNDMASLQNISDQCSFVNTSPYVNNILRVGGWLSRSASLPTVGRPLVMIGLRNAYPTLCSLVERTQLKQEGTILQ
jgi:hypothetical protein